MDVEKDQQDYQLIKKKFNHRQHTRKTQHFKRKHRRLNMQIQLPNTLNIEEFQNLSISQQSSIKQMPNCLDIATNTDPTLLLIDYLTISNAKFKEMLQTLASEDIDTNPLIELLNKEDVFIFIRQLTQLVNKLNYSKLQHEQWSYYYHIGMTDGIWTGRVSKKMALANTTCLSYGRSRTLIQQRLQKYKQQIEKFQYDINEYIRQAHAIIDMTKIMNIINHLIHKHQSVLRIELERRRTILKFDAKEHHLVKEFYQENPRKTEVSKRIF